MPVPNQPCKGQPGPCPITEPAAKSPRTPRHGRRPSSRRAARHCRRFCTGIPNRSWRIRPRKRGRRDGTGSASDRSAGAAALSVEEAQAAVEVVAGTGARGGRRALPDPLRGRDPCLPISPRALPAAVMLPVPDPKINVAAKIPVGHVAGLLRRAAAPPHLAFSRRFHPRHQAARSRRM